MKKYNSKSGMLFRDLGTDVTSTIGMFLPQAAADDSFPHEIRKMNNPYITMAEDEIYVKLEKSRGHEKEGRYREADAVVSEIRSKYRL